MKNLSPVIVLVFSLLVSIFSGVNQAIGLFSNINRATVAVSVVVALILFFYLPVALSGNPIVTNGKLSAKSISVLATLIVLLAGTVPFTVEYFRAYNLSSKGEKSIVEGSSVKAKYYWGKAARIYSKLGLNQKSILSQLCLAEAYSNIGKAKEANEIIDVLDKSNELSIENQAKLYVVKGNQFEALGRYTEAENSYRQAAQVAEPQSITKGTAILNLAVIISKKGPTYERDVANLNHEARNIFAAKKDFQGLANALINLASLFESEPEKAKRYLDSAEGYAQKVNSKRLLAIVSLNRGLFEKKQGNLDNAIADYEKARALYEEINEILGRAEIQIRKAYVDLAKSNFGSALQKVKESIAIVGLLAQTKEESNFIYQAKLISMQADIMDKCNNGNEAEILYKQALDLLQTYRCVMDELSIRINYTAFLQRMNRNSEAQIALSELYNLVKSDFSNSPSQVNVVVINNVGKLYQDMGNLEKADEMFVEASSIAVNIGDNLLEAEAKENLAIVRRFKNLSWQPLMMEALDIYRKLGSKTRLIESMYNFYAASGDLEILNRLMQEVDDPSIENSARSRVLLGIIIRDISASDVLILHRNKLAILLKQLAKENDEASIGRCNLRLAQVEEKLGNGDKVTQYLPEIEKRASLIPFPMNIAYYTDLGILKVNLGEYEGGVAALFNALDVALPLKNQNAGLLVVIGAYWPMISTKSKETYAVKLKGLYKQVENGEFKQHIKTFLNNNGIS